MYRLDSVESGSLFMRRLNWRASFGCDPMENPASGWCGFACTGNRSPDSFDRMDNEYDLSSEGSSGCQISPGSARYGFAPAGMKTFETYADQIIVILEPSG